MGIGIRQGPGNWSSLMIMSLNNERRTGAVRHRTAHFGVVPPVETERNPDDNVPYSQGQADQRLLTPLPHSPPLPQERQARVGREQGVYPAPAAFHASISGALVPLTTQSLPLGGGEGTVGPGAAGADSRSSKQAGSLRSESGEKTGSLTSLLSVRWTGEEVAKQA